jgi:hypothetical protein
MQHCVISGAYCGTSIVGAAAMPEMLVLDELVTPAVVSSFLADHQ